MESFTLLRGYMPFGELEWFARVCLLPLESKIRLTKRKEKKTTLSFEDLFSLFVERVRVCFSLLLAVVFWPSLSKFNYWRYEKKCSVASLDLESVEHMQINGYHHTHTNTVFVFFYPSHPRYLTLSPKTKQLHKLKHYWLVFFLFQLSIKKKDRKKLSAILFACLLVYQII